MTTHPTTVMTLEGPLAALRESEIRLLTDLANALTDAGEGAAEDRQRLIEVAQDLRELFFLVVIIGEFNAGKSTFINALLDDDLLPMGITPTTEVIELIKYGDQASRVPEMRSDGIRVWAHPNTGAPGVALVDTPGTGSIFAKHEKTAKSFLHRSDLVIFVISAKRAFAETERLYLELAKNYGKKIILVVNQVDLLDAGQQMEVRRFVEQQVQELLDLRPLLFMVSAKDALSGKRDASSSGIDAVKAHLRGVFSEMPPAKQKLLTPLDLAEHIAERYKESVKHQADAVSTDTSKARDIQSELENQSQGLGAQLKTARAEIDRVFEGMRQRGLEFINSRLSIRQIGRSLREINDASSGYINALIDNSRAYWRSVIERLNTLRAQLEGEVGGLDAGVYAEQREALEEAIRIAETELKTYSTGRVIGEMEDSFRANMNGFLVSSITSVLGIIVSAAAILAQGPVVGLAAAALIVAAPLAVLGGAATYRYYRRVTADAKKDFSDRIDTLQKTYHEAVDTLTQKERARLAHYGNQVLTPIFSRLNVLSGRYNAQLIALRTLQDQLTIIRKGIEEAK